MGEIQEMHEQLPAKPEPRRRARASHELPERSGDGGDGGRRKGRGNRGVRTAAATPPSSNALGARLMGIRDLLGKKDARHALGSGTAAAMWSKTSKCGGYPAWQRWK